MISRRYWISLTLAVIFLAACIIYAWNGITDIWQDAGL